MKVLFITLTLVWIFLSLAPAETVSSVRLLKNAENFDGKLIQYQGEVVGDVMRRGEFAWVSLSDDHGVISVWTRNELTNKIRWTGDYKTKGDILLVEGEFHRFCIEHGGDTDLHARKLQVVKSGETTQHPVNRKELLSALSLVGIAVITGFIYTFFFRNR